LRDQLLHLGITADDSIERHDVRVCQAWRERQEIPLQKAYTLGVTTPSCLSSGGIDVCRCCIDVHDRVSACVEQFVVDDADSSADVQQGCAAHSRRRQLIQQ
jgi:hypothetical protein